MGFLPADWASAALARTVAPDGRYQFVTATGPIRVTASAAKLEAAREALAKLQSAPAVVPIELSFEVRERHTVQRLPVEPPVVDRQIPIPETYTPPRIIPRAGGYIVIPSQPRTFTTRRVDPGTSINPSGIGYITGEPEVRMEETVTTGLIARRFSLSTVPGKEVSAYAQRQVSDPAALRALALRYGAIPANEPAWTAASTVLSVTPEFSGGSLMVKILPKIYLPAAVAGQPAREIPLTACLAGVLTARGSPASTGMLPKTDPEFYRTFLGAAQAVDGTVTAVTVAAQVQYVGNSPP